jgi:uncharacterized protein YcbX
MYLLSAIYIYPIKSLGGISLNDSGVTERGLKYDRRWLLVDENGKFITQRIYPQMTLIDVELDKESLRFKHKKNNGYFNIDINSRSKNYVEVIIWNDKVVAETVSENANQWFSEMLKIKCSLVYMPERTNRFVDKTYASNNEIVSFADAYPFLIIGQESLKDLNNRLDIKLPINRFRPNFVFTGGKPFDEDKWKSFSINDIIFYPVKPCSRCVITTINHETAEKSEEPLKTLAGYRTVNNKVMFGQNLLHNKCGSVKIGDELKVQEWK